MIWPPALLAGIVALALVVWAGFYMLGTPLNPAEAVVMVGLCGVIAYGARAAVLHFFMRRRNKAPASHAPRAPKAQHQPRARAAGKRRKRRH